MSFEQRFVNRATADPEGFAEAVQATYGFNPEGVARLLGIAGKLGQPSGAMLSAKDVADIKALHPHLDAHVVDSFVAKLHKLQPGQRSDAFIAVLANDAAAMQGDYVNAGDTFKQVSKLAREFATQEISDTINAKRGGTDVAPRHTPEEGSVRAHLENQFTHRNQRAVQEALAAGDPTAEAITRDALAVAIDNSLERLQQPDASTRDTVAAAFDYHAGAELAGSEFGVTQGDN